MKKQVLFLWFIFLLCVIVGCGKEEEKKTDLSAGKDEFYYAGTEDVDGYIVTEEGLLYTTKFMIQDNQSVQQISIYDLEGNCLEQNVVVCGGGTIVALEEKDGILYALCYDTLCRIDTNTWEAEDLYTFHNFSSISNMVLLGDYCYILGTVSNPSVKNYDLPNKDMVYEYRGETIARISVTAEEKVLEQMQVEFPILITKRNEDSMLIYSFEEEQGFVFLEFVPSSGTLTQVGQKESTTPLLNLTPCENGYLFSQNGKLYYGVVEGTQAELPSDSFDSMFAELYYEQGFLFIKEYEKELKRIYLREHLHDNQTIQVLVPTDMQYNTDKPYGCGYLVKETQVSLEEYALKVLAQDTDFDLYILSSRDNYSYNLKKNGAFLPLNEVEGVQEYLDACFPYVKELATNEEGDIWMIPVGLAIPGIVYDKEYCEENGVDFTQMDFADFLKFTEETEQSSPEKTAISFFMVKEEFLGQYLQVYDSFDTEVFREYAQLLHGIQEKATKEWMLDGFVEIKADGQTPDFYYNYNVYRYLFLVNAQKIGDSERFGVMGVPAIDGCPGNVGTITYVAVNPKSDNLEATLDYIMSLCKHLMEQKDLFMLEDKTTYIDTSFKNELYELYANGTVRFDMDNDVYYDTFSDYLEGEMELEEMITEIERRRLVYMGE